MLQAQRARPSTNTTGVLDAYFKTLKPRRQHQAAMGLREWISRYFPDRHTMADELFGVRVVRIVPGATKGRYRTPGINHALDAIQQLRNDGESRAKACAQVARVMRECWRDAPARLGMSAAAPGELLACGESALESILLNAERNTRRRKS
jgi:hypothetical protein